jgi:hypothetical protein
MGTKLMLMKYCEKKIYQRGDNLSESPEYRSVSDKPHVTPLQAEGLCPKGLW